MEEQEKKRCNCQSTFLFARTFFLSLLSLSLSLSLYVCVVLSIAERGVCFHMYAIKENKERRSKIPKFWENGQLYAKAGEPSMKRLNTLIEMKNWPEDEWPQNDKEYYTLGKVRSPDKFFKTFGIHLKEEKVEGHLCRFVGKPMMKVFLPALRSDGMGIDYNKIDYEFKDPALNEENGIW